MTPTDEALDDLHAEQQRKRKVVAQMVEALHRLGYSDPLVTERRAAYRSVPIKREDFELWDRVALQQFHEERHG